MSNRITFHIDGKDFIMLEDGSYYSPAGDTLSGKKQIS